MKESVAIAKEADRKKESSPTRSDNSIQRLRNEPERQLGSLRDVIGNIRRNGGTPSVESIATELSGMHSTAQRAPALLALQRTHGNRYVQRVVTGIQAKLKVRQPGDIYEQEADRVADEVMRMPEPEMQRQPEEEEEEEPIRTKGHTGQTPEVIPNLESSIYALKGGGHPLPEADRSFMERRFGVDFSRVRVHTNARAAESALALNARAYTVGCNIVFSKDQYAPLTPTGQRLMAHELAHVVQQRASGEMIQRLDLLPSLSSLAEAEEQYRARERLRRILTRHLPARELDENFQRELRSIMSDADIRQLTFPIDRESSFLEQVDRLGRLHMGPETIEERIAGMFTSPPAELAAPAIPRILPEWLSLYRDGRAGFFVGLSFGPEAGDETLAAQLTAHFRNRGLPISSDLLTQLMTSYDTGVQQLESLLNSLLPTEISAGGAARLIAEHLRDASLEASVRAERLTQAERAEEAAERIQVILPGEEASRDLGPLSDLVNDLGAGITITIRWR